jgi:hypothetical protein
MFVKNDIPTSGLVAFHCSDCKTHLEGLEDRIAALELKVNAAPAPAPAPAPALDQTVISEIVAQVINAVLPKVMNVAREEAEEATEAAGKKLKLVAIGLPEENPDNLESFVYTACDKMNIDRADVVETFRNGQARPGRPRIAKIKFKNSSARHAFLIGFRGVRGGMAGAENAWVRPDLTYRQRQADRVLLEELQTRRDRGELVKISRGQIVPKV